MDGMGRRERRWLQFNLSQLLHKVEWKPGRCSVRTRLEVFYTPSLLGTSRAR